MKNGVSKAEPCLNTRLMQKVVELRWMCAYKGWNGNELERSSK